MSILTGRMLRERIYYVPSTGDFRWRSSVGGVKSGSIAGCLADGYRRIGIYGRVYQAANLAWLYMTGELPPDHLDHINGDGTDNRFPNLRLSDPSLNARNMRVRPNKTGYTGITWEGDNNRFKVRITKGSRRVVAGHSRTLGGAIEIRRSAEKRYGYTERHGMEP